MSKVIVVVDAVDINGTEQKKYDNIFYNNILSKYLAIETSNGTEVIFFYLEKRMVEKISKIFRLGA